MGFKDPSFQDRVGSAAEAKRKALEQLKNKPQLSEQELAERQAARESREAAEAEKRAARKAAQEAAKAEKNAAKAAAAAVPEGPSEAELKAARDARYAARKSRK